MFVDLEAHRGGLRPLQKEAPRRGVGDFARSRRERRGGEFERVHGIFVLPPEAERGAARDENREVAARLDERGDLGRGFEDVLEVVEDEEEAFLPEAGGEGDEGRPVREAPVRGMPVRGMPVRGMPVRGMPVRGMPVRVAGRFEGELRLPDAPRSGECDQPRLRAFEKLAKLLEFPPPPDERGDRSGHSRLRRGGRRTVIRIHIERGGFGTPFRNSREERGSLAVRQIEGFGEGTDGVGIRALPLAAFEGTYGFGGESGLRGEFFLRESASGAKAPQKRTERNNPSHAPKPPRRKPPPNSVHRAGRRRITQSTYFWVASLMLPSVAVRS